MSVSYSSSTGSTEPLADSNPPGIRVSLVGFVSCTQQDCLAATLVDDGLLLLDGHDALEPELTEVIVDQCSHEQPS